MPHTKDQQSHSLHLILVYFIFVTTIFRLIVFKFYDFVILLLESLRKIHEKCAKLLRENVKLLKFDLS